MAYLPRCTHDKISNFCTAGIFVSAAFLPTNDLALGVAYTRVLLDEATRLFFWRGVSQSHHHLPNQGAKGGISGGQGGSQEGGNNLYPHPITASTFFASLSSFGQKYQQLE